MTRKLQKQFRGRQTFVCQSDPLCLLRLRRSTGLRGHPLWSNLKRWTLRLVQDPMTGPRSLPTTNSTICAVPAVTRGRSPRKARHQSLVRVCDTLTPNFVETDRHSQFPQNNLFPIPWRCGWISWVSEAGRSSYPIEQGLFQCCMVLSRKSVPIANVLRTSFAKLNCFQMIIPISRDLHLYGVGTEKADAWVLSKKHNHPLLDPLHGRWQLD